MFSFVLLCPANSRGICFPGLQPCSHNASPVLSFQEFCLFAVVGLVSDFFLQMLFFTTVLSIDIRRMEVRVALPTVLLGAGSVRMASE